MNNSIIDKRIHKAMQSLEKARHQLDIVSSLIGENLNYRREAAIEANRKVKEAFRDALEINRDHV